MNVFKPPGVVLAETAAAGLGHGHEKTTAVKLEDPHAAHVAFSSDGGDVGGIGRVLLPLLEPCARLPDHDATLVTGLEQLRGAVGQRRGVVTHRKSQQHEPCAQHQQGAQGPPWAQPTGAQDRVFRALRQPGHDKDGADQHRDGHQIVKVAGDQEHHIQQRVAQLVAVAHHAPANGLQFIDEVKKEQQRQKAQCDKRNGRNHLVVDQPTNGFHARTFLGRRHPGKAQLPLRLTSQSRLRAITPV